jgi:dihydroflavonol-4-reductase
MKRALVTGATGFVGANLARALPRHGRQVQVLVRSSDDEKALANLPNESLAKRMWGDLRDFESLKSAVAGCDEVYHVAADYRFWARNPDEIYQSNVKGTDNLLRACRETGVPRVIYTSTVGTVGLSSQPEAADESTPTLPDQFNGHYKRSKWEAEQLALRYAREGLDVVIVNPSTPIGPWDRRPTPTGRIILDFIRGRIPAYVDTGLNFVHVDDVVAGEIQAAEKGKTGERYILGHRNLRLIDFLRILSDITRRPAPRFRIPYSIAWLAGCVNTFYADYVSHQPPQIELEAVKMSRYTMFFDPSKAVRELGIPQTPVEKAVEDAVRWYTDHGYLT